MAATDLEIFKKTKDRGVTKVLQIILFIIVFVLCKRKKKKEVNNDFLKLNFSPFPLRDGAKFCFRLCLKIVLIRGISAKMLLSLNIFLPLRSSLLEMIL